MNMIQVLGVKTYLDIKDKVEEEWMSASSVQRFKERMREDPDYALKHQDDLRILMLDKENQESSQR